MNTDMLIGDVGLGSSSLHRLRSVLNLITMVVMCTEVLVRKSARGSRRGEAMVWSFETRWLK